MEATTAAAPPLVGLSLEGPRPQRRATVGFRIILAIPHLFWSVLLTIVGALAAIAAWVAALLLGELPDGLGNFLGRIVRYTTRFNGYMFLLTDRYPPFSLAAEDYAVEALLPPRGRLNRAAVLFRLIIAIPAFLVVTVVSSGVQLAMVIVWLITLIAGRMPTAAFEAVSAFLRYEVRTYSWILMLTSTYPSGLFGDAAAPSDLPAPPPPPGAEAVTALPPPPPAPTAAPRLTRLSLSNAGRRLMVTFIVVGVLLLVGQIVVAIVSSSQSDRALRALDREYAQVGVASQSYGVAVQGCGISGGLECLRAANVELADDVRDFRADLIEVEFPAYALDDAEDLVDTTDRLLAIVDQMALTSDPDGYEDLVREFQDTALQMDTDYLDLRDLLVDGF